MTGRSLPTPWSSARRPASRAHGRRKADILDNVVRRYAGYNVPRYTSYPTAADFSSHVGTKEHEGWLGRLEAHQAISAYLHVPYCREICLYCGCNTKMAVRDDVIDAYRR